MATMLWIAGIDEVGRGPIAGPVAVCVCMMRLEEYKKMKWKGLTDSKKMTEKNRENWFQEAYALRERGKLEFSVQYVSNIFIDKHGISKAISHALKKASTIISSPETTKVLLDGGLRAPKEFVYQHTIIKGDQKEKMISLASVIAKVTRDALMKRFHKKYPHYKWADNKGYGTSAHYSALGTYGLSPLHRKSFLRKK